jgi:hypothetical protein
VHHPLDVAPGLFVIDVVRDDRLCGFLVGAIEMIRTWARPETDVTITITLYRHGASLASVLCLSAVS